MQQRLRMVGIMTTTRCISAVATCRCHRSTYINIRVTATCVVVALLLFMFCIPRQAYAHDPGLSYTQLNISGSELVATLTFSDRDIETQMQLDQNHDGLITIEDLSAASEQLQQLASSLLVLTDAGVPVPVLTTDITTVENDAIRIQRRYAINTGAKLEVLFPVLDRLPRGHRQHLTIYDGADNLQGQYILDANSAAIEIDNSSHWTLVLRQYIGAGVWHILIGFDHILFLVTLLLPAVLVYRKPKWQSVDSLRPAIMDILKVITAFTVAHSITLALAVLDIVTLPPRLVESVIAFSVLVVAINNLWPVFPASRNMLAFAFGLIHGFGFASVLMEFGLPAEALLLSLLGFNLGVEAGQLAIVAIVFPLAAFLRHTLFYRNWVFHGGSAIAALVALVWMFERVFDYELPGLL